MSKFVPPPLPFVIAITVVTLIAAVGCHRNYYRRQADCEANALLDEKASHLSRPPNQQLRIDVDRRSRMFNPFDLDFQPMPLDDPSSYEYMQCVDGRRGYPLWEAAGLTNTAESPDWWQFLPLDDDGVLVLNSENAVRIALLHSPAYQSVLEDLYLAALDVSNERFVFDTQFFGGAQTFLTASGRRRAGGQSSTRYEVGPYSNGRRALSMQRRFATGADLVVGVANSIVWELSGPNSQSATTLFDFALLQPLLRNAGRDVVMENLTQSERELLASVRAFERFRREFFLTVTIGSGGGGAGGYLGLLQTQLEIRNLEQNIARQTENLLILEDTLVEELTKLPEQNAGPASIINDRIQVAQAKSSLLQSQTSLVNAQANYERTVDSFLRTLGLPPYICTRLEDPMLQRFELIDADLIGRREQLSAVRMRVGEFNVAILEQAEFEVDEVSGLPESRLEWTDNVAETLATLRQELEPLETFTKTLIEEDLPRVSQDIEFFQETLAERTSQNEQLRESYEEQKDQICSLLDTSNISDSLFDIEISKLSDDLRAEYDVLVGQLESYQTRVKELEKSLDRYVQEGPRDDDPAAVARALRDEVILASQDLLSELADDVLALQLIQARARTESVLLPDVDIEPTAAVQIARVNRRDWANARADLVDVWRQIEVRADDLESSLDVVFNGDIGNVGNNPLDLRSSTGRLRVGLQWDAPITRLRERNSYRAALISYERAKRAMYGFEDDVWQTLRTEIRQLQANRLTFELGRQAVVIAASQVELNADRRALNEARSQGNGPTAARDAITALDALLRAQNTLLGIFVNYEVVRRNLDLDLGTMELTPEGLWIDPVKIDPDYLLSLPGTTDSGMIGGCNHCCLPRRPLPREPYFGLSPIDDSGQQGMIDSAIPDDDDFLPAPVLQGSDVNLPAFELLEPEFLEPELPEPVIEMPELPAAVIEVPELSL
ncbi:coiled-coil domain-containing protein [Novipirellula artificiosorum]|uniref:Outer membrane efflux protein n=1 Tax=Novipirellula artificiosorum TaxID=2528016 RepID=A0A5C6DIY8_9BACT|nr:hypothetical protein [Novipirellula artificiosorum]TWU36195.1 hypothetical protein Poly41_39490 [Novipirellula artificiosorum]